MKRVDQILKGVLVEINPKEEQIKEINVLLKKFLEDLKNSAKKNKVSVQIFIGGSFAKGTLIKKKEYDVDIFLRFDKKYKDEEISNLTEKLLKSFCEYTRVHGSRDYFKVRLNDFSISEIVPVKKISNPKYYENVTDLSYFHVSYVRKKLKSQKIREDIKIAKAFCHACEVYGAESYVKGFSGYALELLVYNYKGFEKFISAMAKSKEKIVIDIGKQFKNQKEILMNLNEAKLQSPIIFVDPTYKYRNVTAALSKESFEKFKNYCKKFLKKPSKELFKTKKIDLEKIQSYAKKKNFEFLKLRIETEKQGGDIAGTKLLKFHKYLNSELERYFEIKDKRFIYDGESRFSESYFVLKKRNFVLYKGPMLTQKNFVQEFKKVHKTTFQKSSRIFANEKFNLDAKRFIGAWKNSNTRKTNDMSISGFYVL